MKILFLASADNYHTKKWCNYFTSKGHEVHVISFTDDKIDSVHVHPINCGVTAKSSDLKKIKYLFNIFKIKQIIKDINPDIINAHYVSSYGMVAALLGIKNYVLSVWGADIYDFPRKSLIHNLYIRYALRKATYIFSTSKAMAKEIGKYTKKNISITPFGVKTDLFSPNKRTRKGDKKFIVGTVKALTPKYGIDVLLKAVRKVIEIDNDIPIELRIAGKGDHELEYKDLAKKLAIDNITKWLGFISQDQVAIEWANMDLAIVPSVLDSESFGVSAVEAESCETPVIISDIPGLMEATLPGITSVVVPRKDSDMLAKKIIELYKDKRKRDEMGKAGRDYVIKMYDYEYCFNNIEKKFKEILTNKGK